MLRSLDVSAQATIGVWKLNGVQVNTVETGSNCASIPAADELDLTSAGTADVYRGGVCNSTTFVGTFTADQIFSPPVTNYTA